MPEVIEREIMKHAVKVGKEFAAGIQNTLRQLAKLVCIEFAFSPPTASEIDVALRKRFSDLEPHFVRVPFTREHALAALDRVDSYQPPNGKDDQQFKDSAIWEAVMELARSHRVHLVTMDRGFYKDKKDVTKGLADNLREECAKAGYYVCLHGTIASCLSEMGEDAVSLPPNELAKLIDDRLDKSLLASTAEERNYWLTGERIGQAITTFPTLEPQRDALTFELTYRLADRAEDESAIRLQPSLTVKGPPSTTK